MSPRRALFTALPAFLPTAALAFRQEEPAPPVAADYVASACGEAPAHAALQREVDALFAGRAAPAQLPRRLAALARCPFCGCGLAARENPPG